MSYVLCARRVCFRHFFREKRERKRKIVYIARFSRRQCTNNSPHSTFKHQPFPTPLTKFTIRQCSHFSISYCVRFYFFFQSFFFSLFFFRYFRQFLVLSLDESAACVHEKYSLFVRIYCSQDIGHLRSANMYAVSLFYFYISFFFSLFVCCLEFPFFVSHYFFFFFF